MRVIQRRTFLRAAALLPVAAEAGLARATGGQQRIAPSSVARGSDEPSRVEAAALFVNGLDVSDLTDAYLDKLAQAGVGCWHKSMSGLRSFADAHSFVDARPARIRVATTVRGIREAHREGVLALVLGWQWADTVDDGAGSRQNDWWSTPPRTELPAYYHLGLRIAGIAYNVSNVFGGGCLENDTPLTRAGSRLVEEIHKLGIVLDVGGHTGERTSLDAIALSSGVPVICSHTNIASLNDNPRATSDRVLEAVAKSGGVIGLTAINDFINRSRAMARLAETPWAGVDRLLDQYDYLRKRLGAEHLGLGPDFTEGLSPQRDERMFPPESIDKGPRRFVKGFESIAELPNLVRGLKDRGWAELEIRQVLGENWLRVYEKVWRT
jgi:membrane dipeptidase